MRRWLILLAALLLAIMLPYSLKAEVRLTPAGVVRSVAISALNTVPIRASVDARTVWGGL
jgi:hypothetical protein